MYIMYDKDGNEQEFAFSIDALDAEKLGFYFRVKPAKNKKGPVDDEPKKPVKAKKPATEKLADPIPAKKEDVKQKRGPKAKE